MKKILIVNNNLHIGGIQKSLVNLLNEISGKYEIDLLLFNNAGELKTAVPRGVNVISGGFLCEVMGMTYAEAKSRGAKHLAARVFWTVVTRVFGAGAAFGAITALAKLGGSYDAAISFMQSSEPRIFYGGCAEYVLNSVQADLKICFIHCDFANYGGNTAHNRKTLLRFDRIAAVSRSVGERLIAAVPDLDGRVYTVHNCYDYAAMERMGCEYAADFTEGAANLFTAARLHSEKGILRMIPILGRMKKDGFAFIWRIAGDGADRSAAERLISEWELSENVILLGSLINPYPYFRSSDMVIVPSYNEAAPMVFGEAEFFGVPVFTTDTVSAREMIADRGLGVVCRNNDADIESSLRKVLADFERKRLPEREFDNSAAVREFDMLVGN